MDAVLIAAGAALVATVGWDIAVTLLHPGARGPVSYVSNRSAWSAVRALSRGRRSLSYAGPMAMLANMLAWVFGLWLGFALIYLSAMPAGDALYASGEALTTVGFGNVEFDPEWLRYVGVFEAAGGLGAFTAAIAYVLSVYPLVTQLRASALYVSDLGIASRDGAVRLAEAASPEEFSGLIRRLIEGHEHVKRFPVLYYFESGDEHESMATLLKGSAIMCKVLNSPEAPAAWKVYGEALQRTLERLLEDLDHDFIGGRTKPGGDRQDFTEYADQVIGAFADEHRQSYSGL